MQFGESEENGLITNCLPGEKNISDQRLYIKRRPCDKISLIEEPDGENYHKV